MIRRRLQIETGKMRILRRKRSDGGYDKCSGERRRVERTRVDIWSETSKNRRRKVWEKFN